MANDLISIRIDENLEALTSTFSLKTIPRVPRCLYEVNQKAYEPRIVSIGPYHHGKPHLKMMEVHKLRFLSILLRRTNQPTAGEYVALMRGMVEEARNSYADSLTISNEDDFVEMLVLDGCFILELLHQVLKWNKDEYLINHGITFGEILRDLILFENQLPFFILLRLFDMTSKLYSIEKYSTEKYVHCFLGIYQPTLPGLRVEDASVENVSHLSDLVVKNWLPSRELVENYLSAPKDGDWLFIRSATELREAGIRFKKGKKGGSLFDIKFKNGVLEIPRIAVYDNTESLYRNVIVCEQFGNRIPIYFTDYMNVMDSLINTGKDVELLCQCGIIENWLGDNEVIATMFNKLGNHVVLQENEFFYAQIFNDVNKHFSTPWNKYKASLMHKYFNTPWALISFFAAVLLLLLTFLQTTFTIFPRS